MTSEQASSRELLTWLWLNYLRRYFPLLIVALIFMTIEGSMLGALSYMMEPMFDRVFVGGDMDVLWWVGIAIMAIFSVRAFAGMVQKVVLTRISQRSAADMRIDLLDRMMKRTQERTALGSAAIPGMIDIMAGIGFFGVLLYGGSEIISGDKTVGQFMTFFTSMGFAFDPLRRLGAISELWQVAASAIERLKELMEEPIRLTSPANPKPAPTGKPDIALDGVELAYGDTPVLRGLSFTAEAGKTTALVGASGAGKSTVFNVLTRLVDPTGGAARIGDVATTEMALEDLRKFFSVVTQDALL